MFVMCVNMLMEQSQAQSCQTVTKKEECEIVKEEDCDDERPVCDTIEMEH